MTEPRPFDPSAPIPEDKIPAAVYAITCAALGYPRGTTPPPPAAAFAAAMKAAAEAMLAAPKDSRGNSPGEPLRKAGAGAVFAAVANLARSGLLPGTPATPSTGYLYAQNNVLTGRPSPLGRVRMAYEAGADVETIPVSPTCVLEMGQDGLVSTFRRDPDNVPRKWEDLRGVVVSVTSHASGAVKLHWVSAGEIGDRRARSRQPNGGAWATDPVTMARTKALHIIGDRGGYPQAPIPIPGLREWQAAQAALPVAPPALPAATPRALPAPSDAPPAPTPPAAPQAPQDAPPPEDAPAPADDAPAQPEASQAPQAGEDAPPAAAAPTWAGVFISLCADLTNDAEAAGVRVNNDDVRAALRSTLDKMRKDTPSLDPAEAVRHRGAITAAAIARLRSM